MRPRDGVRAVAALEAAKGVVVLLAGFGLLALVRHDVQHLAEQIVRHLHLNPASHYPRIFLDAAAAVTAPKIKLLALGAITYALARLIEAYGLWHRRRWAEWLAAVSAAIYIPFEVYKLRTDTGWLVITALCINVLVVALMASALLRRSRSRQRVA